MGMSQWSEIDYVFVVIRVPVRLIPFTLTHSLTLHTHSTPIPTLLPPYLIPFGGECCILTWHGQFHRPARSRRR